MLKEVSILQLHGSMSHDDQRLIFQKTGRARYLNIYKIDLTKYYIFTPRSKLAPCQFPSPPLSNV